MEGVPALGRPGHFEDLAQETYLRTVPVAAHLRGPGQRPDPAAVDRPAVYADAVRAWQRRPRTNPLAALLAEPVAAGDIAKGVALRTALAGLDEDRHEAFVLTQVVGLSYAQAAKACDRPIGRIRSRVARAHFVDAITGERRPALTRPCRRRTAV